MLGTKCWVTFLHGLVIAIPILSQCELAIGHRPNSKQSRKVIQESWLRTEMQESDFC